MSAPVSKNTSGAALIVISSLFYSTYGIWTRLLDGVIGGYTAAALRSAMVVALFLPLVLIGRQLQPLDWKSNRFALSGIVVMGAAVWGPFFYAVNEAGIGPSIAVHYTGIVLGMMLGGKVLVGDPIRPVDALAGSMGLVGVGLMFSPGGGAPVLALFAALMSGALGAVSMVFCKRLTYGPTQSTFTYWIASAIANSAMMILLGGHAGVFDLHIEHWLYLSAFAAASLAASWAFVRGLRYVTAAVAGVLGLLEVVFAVAFGMLLFGERPSTVAFLGCAVIVASTALPYVDDLRHRSGGARHELVGDEDDDRADPAIDLREKVGFGT